MKVGVQEGRAAGQREQQRQADQQMRFGSTNQLNGGPLPHAAGERRSWVHPTAPTGEHEYGGQQRDGGKKRDRDRNRKRRADTRERGQPGEDHAKEGDRDRGRRRRDDLADRAQCFLHRQVGVGAGAEVLVVAADQEDGIVGAGAQDHGRHQHDCQRGHPEPELNQPGYRTLSRRHRNSDGDQRHQHGHRSSVDHRQDEQHQQGGDHLDHVRVAGADDRHVAGHGALSRYVRGQRGARGGALGDFSDPLVGL